MQGLVVSNNALVTINPGVTVTIFPGLDLENLSGVLVKSGGTLIILGPIETDFFSDSTALVIIKSPLGTDTITLTGPTTVKVDVGDVKDGDTDNLDEVQTEMLQMDLTGTSTLFGPVTVRLSPTMPTLGEIEEKVNDTPGVLDIPPFTEFGGAMSFFDVFFEIDTPIGTLHNIVPKHMEAMIFHKPPRESVYQDPEEIPLFDNLGNPTQFTLGLTRHAPDPNETILVCVLFINGNYYPCSQFFVSAEANCPPDHYHSIFGAAYSIFLVPLPDPDPINCGFGLVSVIISLFIEMTQAEIDDIEAMIGPIT